jgi:hypothetical protein
MADETVEIPLTLATKLASVVIRAQKYLEGGHNEDRNALDRDSGDPDVQRWVEGFRRTLTEHLGLR